MSFLKFIINLFKCKKTCSINKMPKIKQEPKQEPKQEVVKIKPELTVETCCLVDSQYIELELFETCNLKKCEQKLEIDECKQEVEKKECNLEVEGGTLLPFMRSDLNEIKKLVEDVKISINESEKNNENNVVNSKSLKSKKKKPKKAKSKLKKKSNKFKKKNN